MNNSEIKTAIALRKADHIRQLESLGLKPNSYGKLRRMEKAAHRAAENYCNGERFGQPYTEADYDRDINAITSRLEKIFENGTPQGFFVNSDPRGYALKIRDNVNTLRQRDWGGYGILAPDNDNF